MQPERCQSSTNVTSETHPSTPHAAQHGGHLYDSPVPSSPRSEDHGGLQESGSEWSLSGSPSPSDYDTWLGPGNALGTSRSPSIDSQSSDPPRDDEQQPARKGHKIGYRQDRSALLSCPHEVLLHVLSHLPATDLLTVKLVSRRLYRLVNSPYAWISAFSKYFPGPTALKSLSASAGAGHDADVGTTDKRAFTRLSGVPSWTGEYLLRTKLLRCLARGRPAHPLMNPTHGRPNKGYATFTYNTRLGIITNMDAKFGMLGDKRLPQYMHGSALSNAVSTSDRRGELAGWGLSQFSGIVRSFEDLFPGSEPWGLGAGDVVGVPNHMAVSIAHGMVYAEGFPGGYAMYLGANEKRRRILPPFIGFFDADEGIPRISAELDTICSTWISKSQAVPRMTRGLLGILCGSSSGAISAYSVGTSGGRDERMEKGELTARWLLSPGVPIVSIVADDDYTTERYRDKRIWAVAVNALGEVFVMTGLPVRATFVDGPAEHFEETQELRAWRTGYAQSWQLVPASRRKHKQFSSDDYEWPTYYPQSVWPTAAGSENAPETTMKDLRRWLEKSPLEIRGTFDGWDMQRMVEVDFAGDDGSAGGQNIVVASCGSSDDAPSDATVMRYIRVSTSMDLDSSVATITPDMQNGSAPADWHCSELVCGRGRYHQVTATALDRSSFALTTVAEDVALKHARRNEEQAAKQTAFSLDVDKHSPLRIPGQRARFVAAGTASGQVFVWNTRAPGPSSVSIINQITPVQVIQTDSPEISSLALTALFLVHGGSDGLVQAWDPLGSQTTPVRTISAALSGRALRNAQNDPLTATRGLWVASAICLDPDPANLRGIVALRGTLRYWSYSSASASEKSSKSHKRKLHRAPRGLNTAAGDGLGTGRRLDLKGVVNRRLSERNLDLQDEIEEEKVHKRLAGRFGLDLLGEDADEEELLAYAKLLSEEEEQQKAIKAAEKRLARDATDEEVARHLDGLSEEDREKWKFASWEERFDMAANPAAPAPAARNTPVQRRDSADEELARAMEMSLQEHSSRSARSSSRAVASSSKRPLNKDDAMDDEMAEAIARSLAVTDTNVASPRSRPSSAPEAEDEDDIARAIRLSLQDSGSNTPHTPSTTTSPALNGTRRTSSFADEEFPALSSSPRGTPSPAAGGWGRKGKRRAW